MAQTPEEIFKDKYTQFVKDNPNPNWYGWDSEEMTEIRKIMQAYAIQIAGESWDAALNYQMVSHVEYPDKETYLQLLQNKQQ